MPNTTKALKTHKIKSPKTNLIVRTYLRFFAILHLINRVAEELQEQMV
jgi:hypothetical protein